MSLQHMSSPIYLPHVKRDPYNIPAISVSSWYDTETSTVYDPEQIPWLVLQGWVVDSTDESTDARGIKSYTFHLSRRAIRPENALQTLINAQTGAFNEGRNLNDARYDDLVAVYASMLDKTETELNNISTDNNTYEGLVELIISSLDSDFTAYDTATAALMVDFGASELLRINTKFDAMIASQKSGLINRGMYSSTIWTTVEAGIERERSFAITDLNDKLNERKLTVEERAFRARVDIRTKILAARDRLHSQLIGSDEQHTIIRNKVVEAMIGFMERREDAYPSVDSIANVATNLGAGSVNSPGG